ncbi:TonB-dependent receptor [Phocaeicola vulgatus]|jgi:hypothetical protein|uniref:TonB-dependent receptor n=1 Tax=Phocaeicola vulgatus TaxID=821 RepID=UPI001C3834AA|nr:TonB-dependent receptor [Phocaeicola vulgatus]MBV4064604.1 TonB-dependent receptor [Phocaeicola vulgatus]MBV4114558.1 TonB-dependent receptor [Phocaeicola vulgatus]
MTKFISILLLLLASEYAIAQKSIMLQGKILDKKSGEPLVGAVVYNKEFPTKGTTSNQDGYYSIQLQEGTQIIVCSYIGYITYEKSLDLHKNKSLNIQLSEDSQMLDEVIVSSSSPQGRVAEAQIGVQKIDIAEMAKTPVLFGERDIIKSIQLLPGVKSEGDGSSGYQVRGGTSSQNLIQLDGATVYNAGHLMGIFSTFNDDALTNASLYKGQIPAQFGGGTSSVFDISTKTGAMDAFHVNGSIGLLSAKLNVEGPIVKDKLSFFAAARRSYIDLLLKGSKDFKDNVMNFYDLNAKLSWRISDGDMLSLSFFKGKDNMGMDDLMDMDWGNTSVALRWFHRFNDKLHAGTSLSWSDYSSDIGMEVLNTNHEMDGYIRQLTFKESLTWLPTDRHTVNIGLQSALISLKSAEWQINDLHEKEKRDAWENSIWINDEWKMTDRMTFMAGLRFNAFSVLGGSPYYSLDGDGNITETLDYGNGSFVKTHLTLEPRFSVHYRLGERHSLKAGFSRNSQNIHAIRNSSMSMPFDRYTMSSNLTEPQTANQISVGYIGLTADRKYELSVEGYYKRIDNVYDYRDGKSFNSEIEIERLLQGGKGRAYGAELCLRKNSGRLTGWIAYTLSWAENKIEGINNNRWYTAGNDRRHDLSIVAMYDLSRHWNFSATWKYNTGQALTAPSAKYEIGGDTYYYYAERNGYRAPAYHRLDFSFTHTKQVGRYTRQWSFGLYNAYNRYNPYIITFENDDTKPSGTKTVQYSLFGIIPSVSFNFKF